MKTLKHQRAIRKLTKAMVCFQRKTVQVEKLLSMVIALEAHQAVPVVERKPTEGKAGDKGNGAAVYTIAHTELFTYGKTGIP